MHFTHCTCRNSVSGTLFFSLSPSGQSQHTRITTGFYVQNWPQDVVEYTVWWRFAKSPPVSVNSDRVFFWSLFSIALSFVHLSLLSLFGIFILSFTIFKHCDVEQPMALQFDLSGRGLLSNNIVSILDIRLSQCSSLWCWSYFWRVFGFWQLEIVGTYSNGRAFSRAIGECNVLYFLADNNIYFCFVVSDTVDQFLRWASDLVTNSDMAANRTECV